MRKAEVIPRGWQAMSIYFGNHLRGGPAYEYMGLVSRENIMANIDNKTAGIITTLRNEAAEAGDLEQVKICDAALSGDASAHNECIRVIIQDGGHGPENWDLLDENNNQVDGITAVERDAKLLESLTCGTAEGWVKLSDGRRVYAQ